MTDPWPVWPELLAAIERFIVEIRFAEIVREESKRTLAVHPDDLGRAQWVVEQAGGDGIITVVSSPFVRFGEWWLIDVNAIEASFEETMAEWARTPSRLFEPDLPPYRVPPWLAHGATMSPWPKFGISGA